MDNVGLIEVVLGDVVHPASYNVVPKKSVKEMKPMESALDLVESRSLEKSELRVDKLVCVTDGQKWYRGRIKDIIQLFGGELRLEVFLIDYGILLKEVNFPRNICKLSDLFKNTCQRSFEFKLNGLIPVTRSFKFHSPPDLIVFLKLSVDAGPKLLGPSHISFANIIAKPLSKYIQEKATRRWVN